MKVVAVTDSKGSLVASMLPDTTTPTPDAPRATLVPGPGQVFTELDLPDECLELGPEELHAELRGRLEQPCA